MMLISQLSTNMFHKIDTTLRAVSPIDFLILMKESSTDRSEGEHCIHPLQILEASPRSLAALLIASCKMLSKVPFMSKMTERDISLHSIATFALDTKSFNVVI